jgi:uncharacterized protein YndB with AHSA1/START domain
MGEELVVRESITIDARPERVWEVLTRPEWTRQYMDGCEIVSEWQVGGPFAWRGDDGITYVTGTLRSQKPGEVLEFTAFDPHDPDLEDIPANHTTVTLRLRGSGESTELTVRQGDFATVADGERRFGDARGWGKILEQIKQLAEQ